MTIQNLNMLQIQTCKQNFAALNEGKGQHYPGNIDLFTERQKIKIRVVPSTCISLHHKKDNFVFSP